ncbi:hypothetical protein D3C80_1893010 [compost metagenome]
MAGDIIETLFEFGLPKVSQQEIVTFKAALTTNFFDVLVCEHSFCFVMHLSERVGFREEMRW